MSAPNTIRVILPFVDNLGEKSQDNLIMMIRNNVLCTRTITNTPEEDFQIYIDVPYTGEQVCLLLRIKAQKIIKHIIQNRTKEWMDKDDFDKGKHPENYCTTLKCLCNF